MKRILIALGLLVLLCAGTAAAQGFGARRPYAAGCVIVGRPYRPYFRYRRPALVIVEPAPLFLRRPWRYHYYHRPYHRVGACWDHRCRY